MYKSLLALSRSVARLPCSMPKWRTNWRFWKPFKDLLKLFIQYQYSLAAIIALPVCRYQTTAWGEQKTIKALITKIHFLQPFNFTKKRQTITPGWHSTHRPVYSITFILLQFIEHFLNLRSKSINVKLQSTVFCLFHVW